jgi:LPXTG-motif cell wall-anchored protein
LKLSYINKGYNSIALIQKKYCTAPVKNGVACPGWISTVTTFREQLLGLAPNPPTTETGGTTGSPAAATPGGIPYWWIAAGALLAVGLGWLLGRKKRAS